MRRTKPLALLLGLALLLASATAWAGLPQAGQPAPEAALPAMPQKEARQYLGIGDKHYFTFSDVDAQVVILNIFNVFCPYCQAEAPLINQLWERLNTDPALKGKAKMFAIAVNNSAFEVSVFRDKYGAAYPITPDVTFEVSKLTGKSIATPSFVVVRQGPQGGQVIYSHSGPIEDLDAFVDMLKDKGGLR